MLILLKRDYSFSLFSSGNFEGEKFDGIFNLKNNNMTHFSVAVIQ